MAGRAVLVALASAVLLVTASSAFPFFEESPGDSEAEATSDVASLPMEARDDSPSYLIHGVHALNGGKPFFVDKDPVTGKVDLSAAVAPSLTSAASEDYTFDSEEHDGIDRKDTAGTLGRPNDIGGPLKVDKTELHDFLNLPTRYSNSASKYPLISSSYANTKVQGTGGTSTTHNGGSSNGGGIKNHKPYSSSSTQQPHYYPIRDKIPTTSEPMYTPPPTTTTTTTTTTTPRPPPPPPRTTTTTTEEPSGWGLDEDYYDEEPTPPPKQPHPSEKPILQSNSHQQSFPTNSIPVTAPSTTPPKPTTTTTTTTPVPTTTTRSPPPPPKVNVLKPFSQSAVVTPSRIESTSSQPTTPSTIPTTKTSPKTTNAPITSTTRVPLPSDKKPAPSEKPTTTTAAAPTKKPLNSSNVVLVPEPTPSNKVVFGKVPTQPPEFIVPPARPNPYGSGATQPFRPLYENGPQDPNRRPEQPPVFHNLGRPLPPGAGDVITVPLSGEGSESEYVSFSFQPPSPQLLRPPAPPRFPGVEPPSQNPPVPFHQPTRPPPSGFKNPTERPKEPERNPNSTRTTAAPLKTDSPSAAPTSRPVVFPDEKKDTVPHEKDVVQGTFNSNPNIPPQGARPQFIHGSAIPVPPYRGDQQLPPHRIPVKPDSTIPPFRVQPMKDGPNPPYRGQPPKEGGILPFRGQAQGEKIPPFRGQPQGEKPIQPFRGQGPSESNIPPFRGPPQVGLPPYRGQPPNEENQPPYRGQPQHPGEVPHLPPRGQPQSPGEVPHFPPRGQPLPHGEVPHLPPRGQPQQEGPSRGQGEGLPPPPRGQPQPEGQPPRVHGENQPPVNNPEIDEELSSLPTDLMPPADPGLNRPHVVNDYPRPLWETSRPKPPHLFNGPQGLRPKLDTVPPIYGQGPPHYKLGPRIKPNQERPQLRKPEGLREPYPEQNLPNILPQFRPNARISNGGPIDPSRTHFVGGPQRMPLMDRPGAGRPHTVYLDGMTPPRPQMHPHLRGTREDDAGILSDVEIGGDFSTEMDSLPPRSVMPRRTGPHIGDPKMRVTTLQMMNYQSHRHVPKTDLSGLKPPYPAPFPSSEKPMDERSSVFVVYPVNTGPSRSGPDTEGGVVVGTRGPNQPLPPSNLNSGDDILGHVDMDDDTPLSLPFALNKQQKPLLNPTRERTDAPILKPHRDHPNSLTKASLSKNEFPYTIVHPEVDSKVPPQTNDKKTLIDQDTASTGDDSEINVIPYLQDYLPFATKKPKEAEKAPFAAQWASEKMDKVEQDARIVVGSGTSAPPTNIQPLKSVSSISRTNGSGSRSPPSRHETVIGDGLGGSEFTVGAVMHTLSAHRSPEGDDKKESETLQDSREPETAGETDSPAFQSSYQNHRLPESSVDQDSQGFQAPFQASVSVGNSALNHGWSVVSGDTTSRPGLVDKADIAELANTTATEREGEVVTPSVPVGTETSTFDIENFKPQLFSGFKPIFPGTEESESGQSKESSRTERQSRS